jgi:hypothetical protein
MDLHHLRLLAAERFLAAEPCSQCFRTILHSLLVHQLFQSVQLCTHHPHYQTLSCCVDSSKRLTSANSSSVQITEGKLEISWNVKSLIDDVNLTVFEDPFVPVLHASPQRIKTPSTELGIFFTTSELCLSVVRCC